MADDEDLKAHGDGDGGKPPVAVAVPRRTGIYRVGRVTDPLKPSMLTSEQEASPGAGNRYDNPDYGVVYFGTDPEACFGETLARLRPSASLARLVEGDWNGFMAPGQIPADWRDRRSLVLARVAPGEVFLDVEALETREHLQHELALGLAALGAGDLDISVIRGHDRRVTRLISAWAYSQVDENGIARYAGIRYLSRLNTSWECWAAFEDLLYVGNPEANAIEPTNPALLAVCTQFGLHVH